MITNNSYNVLTDHGSAGFSAAGGSASGGIPAIFGGVQLQTDPLQAEKPPLPGKIHSKPCVLTENGLSLWAATFLVALMLQTNAGAFSGAGAGIKTDPYRIGTVAQLQEITNGLDVYYVLVNDIDASETAKWNDGKGFSPVGDRDHPFTGKFDGQGYTISGLRIDRFGRVTSGIALFGGIGKNAMVCNVSVQNAWVKGCDCVGILAGINAGTISHCYVSGSVFGSGTAGGLAGGNTGGRVEHCSSAVEVGPEWVGNHLGGLVGSMRDGWIVNCFATGNVKGQENPGGLVGVNNGGIILNCYATGNVESSFGGVSDKYRRGAGGLVAENGSNGKISHCFATGTVKGPAGLPVGGLVGVSVGGACIHDSYCRSTGTNAVSGGGKIYADSGPVDCEPLVDIDKCLISDAESLLKRWDFGTVWTIKDVAGATAFPRFKDLYGANYKPAFSASQVPNREGANAACQSVQAKDTTNTVLQLACALADGSRIIGIPEITSITIQTSYAKMDIALKDVRSIAVENDREMAIFEMKNGDRLKGALILKTLDIKTVFGKVAIGTEQINKISVLASGSVPFWE